MAFDQWQVESIKKEALDLNENEVVEQPPIPVEIYTSEMSGYLGQMGKDSEKWIDTGYDYATNNVRGDILLSLLIDSQTEVVKNRKILDVAPQKWTEEKGKVELERRRLLAAARIVHSGDTASLATIKEIADDVSNTGMVLGIISLAKMAENKLDQISKIKIDKVAINKEYIDSTKQWAEDLISILGLANTYRKGSSSDITYRNRVITLCQKFIDDLRHWLPAVYFNDSESQSKFSSSYYSSNRNSNNGNNTKQKDTNGNNNKGAEEKSV